MLVFGHSAKGSREREGESARALFPGSLLDNLRIPWRQSKCASIKEGQDGEHGHIQVIEDATDGHKVKVSPNRVRDLTVQIHRRWQ